MRIKIKIGIREKFMVYVAGFLVLLGVILTTASITQQKETLKELENEKIGKIFSLADNVAARSVVSILLGDSQKLEDLAKEIFSKEDLSYIDIEDMEGNVSCVEGDGSAIEKVDIKQIRDKKIRYFFKDHKRYCEVIAFVHSKEETASQEGMFGESEGSKEKKIGIVRLGISLEKIDIQSRKMMQRNILLMLVTVILCMVSTYYIFTRVINIPINQLISVVKRAAEKGDLTGEIKVPQTNDEIAALLNSFNAMLKNLHAIVYEVRNTSTKVDSLAQNLSSSSEEMNASTQEVSNTIQQINRGVVNQARKSEETSRIMERMADSVKKVSNSAKEGDRLSRETTTLAEGGMVASGEAAEKILKITDVANQIAKIVSQLGERSQEIGRIVEVITSIADQTNLLALNAAIEAARAGEAGRGFAVVAEEVRKLAENSAGAAEQIGSLIRTIQQETSRAVDSVVATAKEVEEGKISIERVDSSLKKILEAAERTAVQVAQIVSAAEAQQANAEDVKKAISEVASVAEESASSTEEVSSSVEEMTASMQEMASGANELARMASNLQDLVKKFKVKS